MGPIPRIRLSDRVIDAIETMIAGGRFAPGDRFFSENELAAKLEVSRSSIREAVRILEVTGRVVVRHGKGIFIANPSEDRSGPFAGWLRNNETSILDHFEVRLIIEPQAARLAAEKADAEAVAHIRRAHDAFVSNARGAACDIPTLIQADETCHRRIARATTNRTLYYLMRTMTKSLPEGWITSLHIPGRVLKTVDEHGEILEAIGGGDPEAAERRMTLHLNNALEDIRASMERPQPAGMRDTERIGR